MYLGLQAVDGVHQGGQLGQDLVQGVNIDLFQLCGDFRQILHHAVQLGLIQCVQTGLDGVGQIVHAVAGVHNVDVGLVHPPAEERQRRQNDHAEHDAQHHALALVGNDAAVLLIL